MAARAHLVVPSIDRERVLVVDGRLPTVPVEQLFDVSTVLGIELTVVRTQRKLGNDRVIACDLAERSPLPTGMAWASAASASGQVDVGDVVAEWYAEETGRTRRRPAWERHGWMDEARQWATNVAASLGREPLGSVVQLRHGGWSAVFRLPCAGGDLVIKEVPSGLAAEGPLTRWLAEAAPGAVPEVVAIDASSPRFAMSAFEGGEAAGPAAVAALARIQRACSTRFEEIVELGVPDLRWHRLADAVGELATRTDLLLRPSSTLAPSDLRLPPRWCTPDDVARLGAMGEQIPRLARRLDDSLPSLPTVVHSDFHRQNVAATTDGVVVFDWAFAALGHGWFDLHPGWQQAGTIDDDIRSFSDAWGAGDRGRRIWSLARPLAYLHQAVVVAAIADAMVDDDRVADWSAGVQRLVLRALEADGPHSRL